MLSFTTCYWTVYKSIILFPHSDGFLDIYNGTTKKWVPICDDRFTERNAEVVCRQLGFNPLHARYARDKRIEMYPNALVRISYWPDPIQCDGEWTRDKLSDFTVCV